MLEQAQNIFFDLIAAEDKILARLAAQKREAKCRLAAFENALAAFAGDAPSQFIAAKKMLQSKIEDENKVVAALSQKMGDATIRKAALKESADFIRDETKPKNETKSESFGHVGARLAKCDTKSGKQAIGGVENSFGKAAETMLKQHRDLNPKSEIYQVRELLRQDGKPILLSEIVRRLGYPADHANQGKYASLRGTINDYARRNHVFTIESKAPHVIGLLEFKAKPPVH